MDELVAQFLPRFAELAHERVKKALDVANGRRKEYAPMIARELHSLAGEAGLLGLEGVLGIAKRAEDAARQFGSSGSEADAVGLAECLGLLERALGEATRTV